MSNDKVYRSAQVHWQGQNVFLTVEIDVEKLAQQLTRRVMLNASKQSTLAFGAIKVSAPDFQK